GLIECGKTFHPVAVAVRDEGGIIAEPSGAVPTGPTADILQALRQIPMVEARPRLDPRREQRIDQPVIEGKARLIGRAAAGRKHARPGHRKSVAADAQVLHQGDVFREAVVVVAGDVAAVSVGDPAGLTAIAVPYAGRATVIARSALDLVTRAGHP